MAARLNHRKSLSDREQKEQSNNVLSCEEARKPDVLVGGGDMGVLDRPAVGYLF
jgi:hypothetical protein